MKDTTILALSSIFASLAIALAYDGEFAIAAMQLFALLGGGGAFTGAAFAMYSRNAGAVPPSPPDVPPAPANAEDGEK